MKEYTDRPKTEPSQQPARARKLARAPAQDFKPREMNHIASSVSSDPQLATCTPRRTPLGRLKRGQMVSGCLDGNSQAPSTFRSQVLTPLLLPHWRSSRGSSDRRSTSTGNMSLERHLLAARAEHLDFKHATEFDTVLLDYGSIRLVGETQLAKWARINPCPKRAGANEVHGRTTTSWREQSAGRTEAESLRPKRSEGPRKVVQAMQAAWNLPEPHGLISVTGAALDKHLDHDMTPQQLHSIEAGLASAIRISRAWVTSGGSNSGVMSLVGRAIKHLNELEQTEGEAVALGIGVWGKLMPSISASMTGSHGKITSHVSRVKADGGDNVYTLDPNHSHFLFVMGEEWGEDVESRAAIEDILCTCPGVEVPKVLLCVNGGPASLDNVFSALQRTSGLKWRAVLSEPTVRTEGEVAALELKLQPTLGDADPNEKLRKALSLKLESTGDADADEVDFTPAEFAELGLDGLLRDNFIRLDTDQGEERYFLPADPNRSILVVADSGGAAKHIYELFDKENEEASEPCAEYPGPPVVDECRVAGSDVYNAYNKMLESVYNTCRNLYELSGDPGIRFFHTKDGEDVLCNLILDILRADTRRGTANIQQLVHWSDASHLELALQTDKSVEQQGGARTEDPFKDGIRRAFQNVLIQAAIDDESQEALQMVSLLKPHVDVKSLDLGALCAAVDSVESKHNSSTRRSSDVAAARLRRESTYDTNVLPAQVQMRHHAHHGQRDFNHP